MDLVVRNRSIYKSGNKAFTLGQMLQGSGSLYPYHAHASPELYYMISGEVEWTIDGETHRAGAGTAMYHKPYAPHRVATTSDVPARYIWAQWAPKDDFDRLRDTRATRTNIELPPFQQGERRSRLIQEKDWLFPIGTPEEGSVEAKFRSEYLEARAKEPAVPCRPHFFGSVDYPWGELSPDVYWRSDSRLDLQ
ncbi:cupin domain-containing protein [Microbulbifer agarilyticus]